MKVFLQPTRDYFHRHIGPLHTADCADFAYCAAANSLKILREKDETSRISTVWDLLREFGKEELDSWLDGNGLCVVLDILDLPLSPLRLSWTP